MHPVTFHTALQIQADRHDNLGIVRNLNDFLLQPAYQNLLVLRLVDGPMLGEDIFIPEKLFPQQCHLSEWVGDVQMNQVGLKEPLLDIFQAILVHPQHLQLADGIDLWRTDVDLHVGVVCPFDFLDFKRLCHILAVADGKDDGMAILGQCVNHSDAEVTQGRVVRRGKPTQQVQDVHIVIVR